mmetsp:Transcript_17415/g.25940  ORF Transcript_17415/g.25940 Transcript_17415/m.25940 type:complete len:185 (-) Transcript_17415:23-577(-)
MYQCRAGGSHLINCLNRTVKALDKLFELCERICIRHPDRAENTKELMVRSMLIYTVPYMQVGDKKSFAEAKRSHDKMASKMADRFSPDAESSEAGLTDEDIWRHYRKRWAFLGVLGSNPNEPYQLACINCGKFEKEGRKLNCCGACSNALYCSKECQKLHWKQHKADCRANSASRRKKSIKQGS